MRQPTAFGYCRASTGQQQLTFIAQKKAIWAYYKSTLKPKGFAWGGWFVDRGTSGAKPLTERKEGLRLWTACGEGDAVVWSKMDRAFRSVRDGANTMEMFARKKVAIHSLDIGIDTSLPLGKFMVQLLVLLAELERGWISARTKEALKAKGHNRGNYPHRAAAAGWKYSRRIDGTKFDTPSISERGWIEHVFRLWKSGLRFQEIRKRVINLKGHSRSSLWRCSVHWLGYALMARFFEFPQDFSYQKFEQTLAKWKSAPADRPQAAMVMKVLVHFPREDRYRLFLAGRDGHAKFASLFDATRGVAARRIVD